MNNLPELLFLVGIPGSGKTTYAKSLKGNYVIHSSDDIREELFGENVSHSNEESAKVFQEMNKRVKQDLRDGKNVIYDATNLSKKKRKVFLSELRNIQCHKTCVLVAAPYFVCVSNNVLRNRVVPEHTLKRMYMNFQPPHKSEGWDDIDIMISCSREDIEDYFLAKLYNCATGIDYMNQCNHHHALTLGEHSRKCATYILANYPNNELLHLAALLHDEGKVFTMTNINAKGERDGDCHFYQHHCVGAYDSIFYLFNMGYHVDDIIHVANLIYFHMHPYREWKDTRSIDGRLKTTLDEKLYDEVIALHEADEHAH